MDYEGSSVIMIAVLSRKTAVLVFIFMSLFLFGCDGPSPESKPNLIISQATLNPPKFKEGDKVTLTCTIKNIGNAKATPRPAMSVGASGQATVHVAAGAPGTSTKPGDTSLCRTYAWYPMCGTSVRIVVDPNDDIAESNELDNKWEKKLDHSVCKTDPIAAFRKDCVDRINKMRALETLPPLAQDHGHEKCSDDDAKVNLEKGNDHYQKCGVQNTCGIMASISDILNVCIEKQMYHHEKKNYQKNPTGCAPLKWPNGCGHYLNMVDKGFKKVACGIYKTPAGTFKALLNFFK